MLQSVNLRDYMLPHPAKIRADASVMEAMQVILDNKISGLCVVDEAENLVGILSELDCIRAVLADIYNDGDPEHTLVGEAMSTDLITCKPTDNIVEAARSMVETRQRRRPVIEEGRLVGQVSSSNILWALMEHSRRKVMRERK